MRKKVSIDTMTSVTNANATRFARYIGPFANSLKKNVPPGPRESRRSKLYFARAHRKNSFLPRLQEKKRI